MLAVLLAFAAISWWYIRSATIWYDEAITLLTTSGHTIPDWSLGMQLFRPSANLLRIVRDLYDYDVHPPLYFCVLALWRVIFGSSLEAARSLSALFTLGTLLLLYRYAIVAEMRWPSLPVVLYALSAACLRYAYNARPYAMAIFLIVLTLYLANRRSPWTALCAAACVATHYFAALVVGPIVLIEAARHWKDSRRWAVWTCLSFAVLCTPLTYFVGRHVNARPHQYPQFGAFHKELSALLYSAVRGALPSSNLWWGSRHILIVVALFAAAGGFYAFRRKQFTVPLAYFAFLVGFLFIAIVTNKSIVMMPGEYYVGIGACLLVILMADGVNSFPLASPLLVALIVAGLVTAKAAPMWSPPDYRAMVASIRSECHDCAILVSSGGAIPACVVYEAKGKDVYVLRSYNAPEQVVQQIGGRRDVYFIPTDQPQTADLERKFIQSFPSEEMAGYRKIDIANSTSRSNVTSPPSETGNKDTN